MHIRFSFVVMLLLYGLWAKPASSQVLRIPMHYDPIFTPSPVIEVKINDLPPMPFIVDTGSSFQFVINESVALKNHLVKGEKVNVDQTGRTYYRCDVKQIAFVTEPKNTGSLGINQILMADFGEQFTGYQADQPIAGLIGGDVFSLVAIRFDFDAKFLELSVKSEDLVHKENALRVSLLPEKQDSMGVSAIEAQIGKKKIRMNIDTGSIECILPSALKAEVSKNSSFQGIMSYTLSDKDMRLPFYFLKDFKIVKGQMLPSIVLLTPTESDEGLLGMSWLSRFRVTVDNIKKQMVLEPRASEKVFRRGYAELRCTIENGKAIVAEIGEQTQASKAGLKVNDILISVDGKKVDGLNVVIIYRLLMGEAGKPSELIVERKMAGSDKPVRMRSSYVRKGELPNTPLDQN